MRISDWSSDVCSSDLQFHRAQPDGGDAGAGLPADDRRGADRRRLRRACSQGLYLHRDGFFRRGRGAQHRGAAPPGGQGGRRRPLSAAPNASRRLARSEEHTSELQSLMRISYAVFCLKKKTKEERITCNDYTNYTIK